MSSAVENHLPLNAPRDIATLRPVRAMVFVAILLTLLCWAWWPFVRLTTQSWFQAPGYGVGISLFVLGLAIFWCRRRYIQTAPFQLDNVGLWMVLAAIVIRFAGTAASIDFAQGGSWLLAVAGVLIACAGRGNLPWVLPPVLYLAVLLPLPYRVEHAVGGPLQQFITDAAVYIAQLFGYPAVASGKLLLVNNATLDITRLYTGLGDLVPFIALAVGLSLLVDRPWWQRVLLAVSAVPVAIVLLGARAAVLAMLEANGSEAVADFSRYGLWMALLIALVLFGGILGLLSRMFIEPKSVQLSSGSGLKDALPVVISPGTTESAK